MLETLDSYLLIALIALPMVGAALLIAIPGYRAQAVRWAAAAFALACMLLSFYAFGFYDHAEGGLQFTRTWQWLSIPGPWPLGDDGITLTLGIDGISAPMILLTGIVMFTGVLVSCKLEERNKDFFILYFLLLSGVFGVFATLDLFFFFFFYELSVLPMYLLIGVWGSSSTFPSFSRTKEYSAMKLTIYLVAGSVLIWIAIIAIFAEAGLGTFDIIELQNAELSPTFQKVFFPFLAVGFRRARGPLAVPHLVARRPRGRADGREYGARWSADEAGRFRHTPHWHVPAAGGGGVLDAGAGGAGHGKRHLWRDFRDGPDGPEVRYRLLQRQPHGLRADGAWRRCTRWA